MQVPGLQRLVKFHSPLPDRPWHGNLQGGTRLRILHIHDAPHIQGGATTYLRRLLDAMRTRGHASALFSLDRPAEGLADEVACYAYPWPRWALRRRLDFHSYHTPLARSLEGFAARVQPDLVHVQNMAVFRNTVFPALETLRLPVVMTVHDFGLLDPNPTGVPRSGPLAPLRRFLDSRSLRRSQAAASRAVDLFLCPTRALQEALPVPACKTRLLRLPVPRAVAAPIPRPPLRLFFAGTLYATKGVDLLLEAMAQARGAAAAARLEIAGTGDQEVLLRSVARDLGLGERVRFLGFLDSAAMEAAYRRAAVQVLPSRVPENSPLTVLEAGARGRPSIASHAGGVPELLEPPARGWTFPPGDAAGLAEALEDAAARPGEVAERGGRMRAWVAESCDPQIHWDHVVGVYREVAGRARAGARPGQGAP